MSEKKSVIKNIYFQVIEKGIRSALGFVTNVVSARFLSVEMFGYLGVVTSFYNVFAYIGASSTDARIVSNILKSEEMECNDLAKYYWSKFIISYISASGMLMAAYLLFGVGLIPYFLVISIRFAFQPLFVIDQIFEAKGFVRIVSRIKTGAIIVATALKLLLLILGYGIYGVLIGSVCEAIICAAIYFKIYPDLSRARKFSFVNIKTGFEFITKLKWSAVSSLMLAIMTNIDKTLLFKLSNEDTELGYYNAGVSIPQFLLMASPILISSAFPYILKSKNNTTMLVKYTNYVLAFSIAISVLISLLAEKICVILYGSNYTNSSEIMAISAFVLPGYLVYMMKLRVIAHYNNNRSEAVLSFIGLLIFIFLGLFLTSIYGAVGMAIAMTLTYSLMGIYAYRKMNDLKNAKYI